MTTESAVSGACTGSERRWCRMEEMADILFLVALAFMALISALIAYEIV